MQIEQRIGKRRALPLIATIDDKPVGFKRGYALDAVTFNSWIGGVLPSARQHGVADALMRYQEDWTLKRGYQRLQVKSMNHYPAMLHFLIARNYKIIGFNKDTSKMIFEKPL